MSEEHRQPFRSLDGKGYYKRGPGNKSRANQNPNITVPPLTDHGTMANMRFSFADAHMRLEESGWTHEVTDRELPASDQVAGVNMNLAPGAFRELHWHKEAEWGLMLYGNARITAIDQDGYSFIDDVKAGDIWNFEAGIPHSIQGLDQGCEFLLIFSEPDFSENNTMLLSDWLAHTPPEIVASNLKISREKVDELFPKDQKYIFQGRLPESIAAVDRPSEKGHVKNSFSFHMADLEPIEAEAGKVWIVDSKVFPAAQTISAAIVRVEPGGMRELHWHPKAPEWQYFLQGEARMTIFNASGLSRTFDFQAGDVGYVPLVAGHYLQNTGTEPLIFLEVFKDPVYSDISLNEWLATTPLKAVSDHLNLSDEDTEKLPSQKASSPVIWFDDDAKKAGAHELDPKEAKAAGFHFYDAFK